MNNEWSSRGATPKSEIARVICAVIKATAEFSPSTRNRAAFCALVKKAGCCSAHSVSTGGDLRSVEMARGCSRCCEINNGVFCLLNKKAESYFTTSFYLHQKLFKQTRF